MNLLHSEVGFNCRGRASVLMEHEREGFPKPPQTSSSCGLHYALWSIEATVSREIELKCQVPVKLKDRFGFFQVCLNTILPICMWK